MCSDLTENLCSEKRLVSLVKNISDSKTLAEVKSWIKTAVASLKRLKRDYSSFSDVVTPFSAGLTQVSK